MALQLKLSLSSIHIAFKGDLQVRPMRRGTSHMMTTQQKKNRVTRCLALLRRHGRKNYQQILFTDKKIFTVQEKFNRQNGRIYAKRESDIQLK